jgi:hypothetical protein
MNNHIASARRSPFVSRQFEARNAMSRSQNLGGNAAS